MGVTGSFLRSRGVVDDNTAAFERSVAAHNAKAATSRERREAQRQPVRTEAREEVSDIRDMLKGLVPETHTESRARDKSATTGRDGKAHLPAGYFETGKLPNWLNDQIDAKEGPNGEILRRARAEGRIYRQVGSDKFLVEGVAPVASRRTASNGHLDAGYYANSPTARRNRELRR